MKRAKQKLGEQLGVTLVSGDELLAPLTDTGLGERFAAQHQAAVRFCYPWNKWLVWDGQRWARDAEGAVQQLAKQTCRSILAEAAAESDADARKALTKFAMQSESVGHRKAMLSLAQSEPGIPVLPGELDKNPWLLNVQNGTINLKTGKLQPHDKADMITKISPCMYDPDATSPAWLAFLWRIFDERVDLIDFVQKLAGYFLTGDVSEQIFPIFHGSGANGKSTLVEAIMNVMGDDYAMKAPPDFLMLKRGEHPTATADLFGKRLVACVESGEGRRLGEVLVKELTGGDTLRARRMREDYWQFNPTHKLILATNHRPEVRGTDYAIWRRIRLVPFSVQIPPEERDTHLPEKLHAESAGILAWCVRGCLTWQRDGLTAPDDVSNATSDYQGEQDQFGEFIRECCEVDDFATVKASVLLEAYRQWGEPKASQRKLGKALRERSFSSFTNNGTWYKGIGLLTEATEG